MDNMEIFEKNKVTIKSLNRKIDEENMKEIFAGPVRTAVDMQNTKQGYDREVYSVTRTEEDRRRIDSLLVIRMKTAKIRELAEMMLTGKVG